MKLNGTYRIGWFQGNSDFLHGYGMRVNGEDITEGLFERNIWRLNIDIVSTYESTDYISHKILFQAYLI